MVMAKKILKEWVIPYGLLILGILMLTKYVVFFLIVPSGSMYPTIDEHSVLVAVPVHDATKLQRGDIVAFQSDELNIQMVKRLIGLPGDNVVINQQGKLTINGQAVVETYVQYPANVGEHFEVPEGCYLFLGDNRSDSNDARYWDNPYIPAEKIRGKAIFTLWPVVDFGVLK